MKKILLQLILGAFLFPFYANAAPTLTSDFDNDGTDDLTVFRESTGNWFIRKSSDEDTIQLQWGLSGDDPVSGIYTGGDGPDTAVYRPSDGAWYLRHWDNSLEFTDTSTYQWGGFFGDIPEPCDFDGDGLNEITIFRPSDGTWYFRESPTYLTFMTREWGASGDVPIPYDYDQDDICDFAVYRDGTWLILLSSRENLESGTIAWGLAGDVPVPGKYDDDDIVDFAVYREVKGGNSLWVIRESTLAGLTSRSYLWGEEDDIPVILDFDNDGRTDITVWRPSDGNWYILNSAANFTTVTIVQWGLDGDIPVGRRRGEGP